MSGGSWDYVYHDFEETAERLIGSKCVKRRALGLIVKDIAKAMYDIEWVDSRDKAEGSELAAIDKALNARSDAVGRAIKSRLAELAADAKEVQQQIQSLIEATAKLQ